MNTQRWMALAVVVGIAAIVVTLPLLTQSLQQGETAGDTEAIDEPLPTPAPFVTPTQAPPEGVEAVASPRPLATQAEVMEEMAEETPVVSSAPFILARGNFVQIDAMHGGEGTATIYQAPDATRFVRLDPFSVTDAPDLRVALSSHPAPRTQADLASSGGYVDLGALESNKGSQNYDIPVNVRLEQFESVVIFDKQFNIIFTTATLER